jgi:hypothetical protein
MKVIENVFLYIQMFDIYMLIVLNLLHLISKIKLYIYRSPKILKIVQV